MPADQGKHIKQNTLYIWAICWFNAWNDLIFDSQILRNWDNNVESPVTIFLATSRGLHVFNSWEIRSPSSASFIDGIKLSRTWKTRPGPSSCSFFLREESIISTLSSSGLSIWPLIHDATSLTISHKEWIESLMSLNTRDECWSTGPPFFFFFPDGRDDRTQDWITRPCQANGSVTNCTKIGRSTLGEQIRDSTDLIFSEIYFTSKVSTTCQIPRPHWSPLGCKGSWEFKFQAFKKTAKFIQSISSEPKACVKSKN